ncbi:MAG: hypothetical protein HY562_03760 [Ignavibacteriales bacterium]|nr:hypothetical protein [Ignavibacteriales bacterium]
MKRFVFVVLITALGIASVLKAQNKSLKETLEQLTGDAARAYVAPAVSGFGANQNSGWFHRSPRSTIFGFDLEIGVVAMGTFFKDENTTFSNNGTFSFDSTEAYLLTEFVYTDQQYNSFSSAQKAQIQMSLINAIRGKSFTVGFSGPTLAGNRDDTVKTRFSGGQFQVPNPRNPSQDTVFTIPQSLIPIGATGLFKEGDLRAIPLFSPQLTFGTVLGSQFTFRYLPSFKDEDLGLEYKYFGFGVQHNPSVWFGDILPLEISASFFTQSLEASPVFKASATAFGVNASKRLGWGFLNLTPYAGFLIESSSMKFTYDFIADTPAGDIPQKIEFELNGENKTRITAGLSIKVLIVNINADYNWSKYNSASIGVMFII